MSDEPDNCDHQWGPGELCETPLGNVMSPTCRHCGAVKIVVEQRRPVARPQTVLLAVAAAASLPGNQAMLREAAVATNVPPAGATVQDVQLQFFANL